MGSLSRRSGRVDAIEEEALRTGLALGMTLIDTSEGYANGRSEELIGRAIAGQRDRVFLVSKVDRATDIAGACEASLSRLSTSTRNHQSVQATMRISDSSDSRIHCSHESRFYKSGY